MMAEVAKYGNPTIKRAYGDWSSPRLSGWSTELNARAIRGMHQGAFTRGKNSTDSRNGSRHWRTSGTAWSIGLMRRS